MTEEKRKLITELAEKAEEKWTIYKHMGTMALADNLDIRQKQAQDYAVAQAEWFEAKAALDAEIVSRRPVKGKPSTVKQYYRPVIVVCEATISDIKAGTWFNVTTQKWEKIPFNDPSQAASNVRVSL
jgi:hypothetical protein